MEEEMQELKTPSFSQKPSPPFSALSAPSSSFVFIPHGLRMILEKGEVMTF